MTPFRRPVQHQERLTRRVKRQELHELRRMRQEETARMQRDGSLRRILALRKGSKVLLVVKED